MSSMNNDDNEEPSRVDGSFYLDEESSHGDASSEEAFPSNTISTSPTAARSYQQALLQNVPVSGLAPNNPSPQSLEPPSQRQPAENILPPLKTLGDLSRGLQSLEDMSELPSGVQSIPSTSRSNQDPSGGGASGSVAPDRASHTPTDAPSAPLGQRLQADIRQHAASITAQELLQKQLQPTAAPSEPLDPTAAKRDPLIPDPSTVPPMIQSVADALDPLQIGIKPYDVDPGQGSRTTSLEELRRLHGIQAADILRQHEDLKLWESAEIHRAEEAQLLQNLEDLNNSQSELKEQILAEVCSKTDPELSRNALKAMSAQYDDQVRAAHRAQEHLKVIQETLRYTATAGVTPLKEAHRAYATDYHAVGKDPKGSSHGIQSFRSRQEAHVRQRAGNQSVPVRPPSISWSQQGFQSGSTPWTHSTPSSTRPPQQPLLIEDLPGIKARDYSSQAQTEKMSHSGDPEIDFRHQGELQLMRQSMAQTQVTNDALIRQMALSQQQLMGTLMEQNEDSKRARLKSSHSRHTERDYDNISESLPTLGHNK